MNLLQIPSILTAAPVTVQVSYQAASSYCSNSTSPSTAFLTLAPLANSPTLTITEPTAFAMTASLPVVATPFPPEPSCFPFCDIVMTLLPVPNSTSSDVAWQHAPALHTSSHLSHSIAADHASKASRELPTAADTQGVSGQNSSTGQLGRQASPPVNFANWWWSVPIINTLCTVLLVETSWTLARLLASICIAKVTAAILAFDTLSVTALAIEAAERSAEQFVLLHLPFLSVAFSKHHHEGALVLYILSLLTT